MPPERGAPPTAEQPAAGPPTGEQPIADAGPPTAEQALPEPIPPETEAPHAQAADAPQADPGPGTAETPQLDPNQPRREQVPPPVPVEQTGAGDWEPPPPRDDWGFDEDEDFHDDGDPNMAGAARTGRRHGEGGNRGGGFLGALLRHPFRILATVVLILILVFLNSLFQPFVGEGHGKVVVDIPKGSSVGEVGDLLEKKGVISDGFVVSGSTLFQARVTIAGKRSDLFAGKFTMKEGMSYGDAIDELSKEPKPAEQATKPGVVTVTIPEGQSRPITAKLVKEDGVKGNYLKATKKSKILNPEKYGGKNVKNLEGFLFPDTWEFKTNKPVKDLVALQLQDFKKQIKKVNMKYAKSKNLTIYDVVTIASIIEREAAVPKQRKLVASVIYNRLHEGMTLGMDSTIRFATGNYEKPLTESELESNSPYNTRNHAGLPPGPINSPGLAAITRPPTRRKPNSSSSSTTRTRATNWRSRKPKKNSSRTKRSTRRRAKPTAATSRPPASERGKGLMPGLAVIGHPVAHSRSPDMQTAALSDLGLAGEWTYGAIDVAPEDFEATIAELSAAGEYAGVNITVPHKEAALTMADEASEGARAIGAANTLTFRDGQILADEHRRRRPAPFASPPSLDG